MGQQPRQGMKVTGERRRRGSNQLVSLQCRTQKHLGGPSGSCFAMPLEMLPEALCSVTFYEAHHCLGAAHPDWEVGRETASPPLTGDKIGLRRCSLPRLELKQVCWLLHQRPRFWGHLGLQPTWSPALQLCPEDHRHLHVL